MSDIPDDEMIIVKVRDVKGQKLDQFRTTTEKSGIVQIRGMNKEEHRWVLQSFKIPLKSLGFTKKTKQMDILEVLNKPFRIKNQNIRKYLIKILDNYEAIQTDRKKFKTKRFKRKKKSPEAKKSPRG